MAETVKEINIDTNQLWTSLQSVVGNDFEELARQSGFVSRSSSRLTGEMMCYLNTCLFEDMEGNSLNDLCVDLHEKFGIELKKQSLDERFNTHTVKFMKRVYEESFQHYRGSLLSKRFDCPFEQLKVIDATSIPLPEHLSAFYKGSGGHGSSACAKVHHCLELLKGKSEAFYITDGASNDTAYWDSGKFAISKGGLAIFDLGYWRGAQLSHIAEQGAYFLSRCKANVALYTQTLQQGCYETLELSQLLSGVSHRQEHTVFIGQEKVEVRLIIEPVPEKVKKERIKKLKKTSRTKGRKSNTVIRNQMCGYSLWITNATMELLPTDKIREYYGLRWQIELMFKVWKSLLKIDKVARMNIFRFECYLYGTLIAILFSTEILSFIQQTLLNQTEEPIELSEWKAVKIIKKKSI